MYNLENLAVAQGGAPKTNGRHWTNEEIQEAIFSGDDPVAQDLLRFALEEGYKGRIQSDARKVSAAFGFYLRVRKPDGSEGSQQCFNYVDGARKLVVYVNWKPETMPPDVLADYKSNLRSVLGAAFDMEALEPNVPMVAIGDNLDAFKDVIRKVQRRIDPSRSAGFPRAEA